MANYGYGPPSWSPPQLDLDFKGIPSEYTKWDNAKALLQQTAGDAVTNALGKGAVKAIATSVPSNPYWAALHQGMPVIGGLLAGQNLMEGLADRMGLGPYANAVYSGAKSPQGGLAVLNNMPVDGVVPAEMGTYGNRPPIFDRFPFRSYEPELEMNTKIGNTKIQDPAQAKGLAGRRLYNYKKVKIPTSRKINYGSESSGKTKKAESIYSQKQRKKKEEEEMLFQKSLQSYNQRGQNAIPRLGTVPKPVWDTWVPDSSTSNYATFDDAGRFDGLDLETMILDLDTIGLLEPLKPDSLSSRIKDTYSTPISLLKEGLPDFKGDVLPVLESYIPDFSSASE